MTDHHKWTRPADLSLQVWKLWDRGDLLASLAKGESLFPKRLVLKGPTSIDMVDRFGEVIEWINEIRGIPHCRIEMQELKHRVLGANSIPSKVWVDTTEDALGLINKQKDAARFVSLVETTRKHHPELLDWLVLHPLSALDLSGRWDRILAVVTWMKCNPNPGLYLRQIDIPGVHSKFLEMQRGVLAELFDIALPKNAIDSSASGISQFEKRFGFLEKPVRVRFRILDPRITAFQGVGRPDITLDAESFSKLNIGISRVFITENEINYLAFPDTLSGLVIFGAGYGFEMLRKAKWLSQCTVYYWGDIDTHGFAILNQLRCLLGNVKSILMDRATLLEFKPQWGIEDKQAIHDLPLLSADERALFDDLRDNKIQMNLRLEQEKIGFHWVEASIRALNLAHSPAQKVHNPEL